ncbi:MAG TPA: hypothetical protein VMB18_05400 [Terriglobales bacterium]|nr:hypothetical protein [Terriglobales bacterium]
MHRVIRGFLVVAFALSTISVFAQEDFSADIVNNKDGGNQNHAKIYVTKDKWRVEGMGQGRMASSGAAIIDLTTQQNTVLMPDRKMYMQFPMGQGPAGQRLTNFYRARDVDDACSDWLKLSYNKGGTCHKIGSDTVNGRSAVKYEGTNSNGDTGYVWIDKKIAFPIKWEGKNGGGELENIKEGSQPSSLFEIPSDYQKFQMPAGMNMPNMPNRQ